jgi:3-hexulose-6-phosphate synthase/6-phospho-3-hexuloisomerase
VPLPGLRPADRQSGREGEEEENMSGTTIRGLTRETLVRPIVQISLDLKSIDEALARATTALESGADWLEVGTPLILAEGLRAVRALREEFPGTPLIVDLKSMDGGYFEGQMMAEAGADAVVVMGRAYDATIERMCRAGEEYGLLVMGDDLAAADPVFEAMRLERLGVGVVIHHVGFDHRGEHPGLSPLTDLPAIVAATTVPVQAVGGLSIDDAIGCPGMGAPIVVFGAPLAVDGDSGHVDLKDLPRVLTEACRRVHEAQIHYPTAVAKPAE